METQPIHFIEGKRPPMLLLTGDCDVNILPRNTHNLAERMREQGNDVEEIVYPGIDHFRIILGLAPLFRRVVPIRADIARFVELHNSPRARRAPSASDSSFAHMIEGCTRRWNGPCAKPQSVPAITFSRPRFFA